MVNEILMDSCFPFKDAAGKPSYRKGQRECILKILAAQEQGYTLFGIDAPVGFGKSPVIVAVLQYNAQSGQSGFYTTPQKILQNQLLRDFPDVPQIKGRSNYICLDAPAVSYEEGACQLGGDYQCPYDPKFDEDGVPQNQNFSGTTCTYIEARNKCKQAKACGMNTAYLTLAKFFGNRAICVFDEAHGIPEQMVDSLGIKLYHKDIDAAFPRSTAFAAHVDWMRQVVQPQLTQKIADAGKKLLALKKYPERLKAAIAEKKRLEGTLENLNRLVEDYNKVHEDWVITSDNNRFGSFVYYRPITSARFLEGLIWSRGAMVIVASGTIDMEYYIKEAGLEKRKFDPELCVFTAESEFPAEKSPIFYRGLGKLTYKEKDITMPKIMAAINKVIRERQDVRGMIHTFSYERAEYIRDHIAPDLKHLLVFQDQKDRVGSLNAWFESKGPSVFVSTNMTEGVDLKGDLCRYQIYMKIAYANISDKRVAARTGRNDWLWYSMQAIEDIEQASGRATRSKEDWSEMFIFDSSFGDLLKRYNKCFKQWFKARVKQCPL